MTNRDEDKVIDEERPVFSVPIAMTEVQYWAEPFIRKYADVLRYLNGRG